MSGSGLTSRSCHPGAPSGASTHWRLQVPPLGSLEPFLEAISHDYIKHTRMSSEYSRFCRIQLHQDTPVESYYWGNLGRVRAMDQTKEHQEDSHPTQTSQSFIPPPPPPPPLILSSDRVCSISYPLKGLAIYLSLFYLYYRFGSMGSLYFDEVSKT